MADERAEASQPMPTQEENDLAKIGIFAESGPTVTPRTARQAALQQRIDRLREHVERVQGGTASPGIARELEKAERELRELG